MYTVVSDTAPVTTQEAQVFQCVQQGSTLAQWILRNVGSATINYRVQENNGSVWADLGVLGTDYNNTLTALQTKLVPVTSSYSQVRLMAYAGAPSTLAFQLSRSFDRPSGGNVPILTF